MRSLVAVTVFLLLGALPQFPATGQDLHPLQRLEGLDLEKLSGAIPTFYSEGFEERAENVRGVLGREAAFFQDAFGIDVSLYLAVLDPEDWAEISPTFPYGTLWVSEAPHIVALPAMTDGPVYEDFRKLRSTETDVTWRAGADLSFDQAAASMIDLIAFHEIGHIVREALGIGRPSNWFNEFFATYLAYSFLRAEKPELAAVWNGMMQLKATAARPAHTTLADFEELFFEVGLENYVWYEARFQTRVHEVYEALGLGFISQVADAFPGGEGTVEEQVLLGRLEEILPGFSYWGEGFHPRDGKETAVRDYRSWVAPVAEGG